MRCVFTLSMFVLTLLAGLSLLAAQDREAEVESPPTRERVEGASLWPLERGDASFELTEDSDDDAGQPRTVRQRTSAVDRRDGAWRVELEGVNTLHVVRTRRGATRLYRLDLPQSEVAAVFLDPVTVLPATLEPGERPRERSRVQVFNLESGELEHEGNARSEITNFAKARFDTPAGRFEGYLVEITMTIDLDMAEMRLHFDCGLVPGRGIVYRRVRSTIEKMGLFGSTTEREAKLAEGGA